MMEPIQMVDTIVLVERVQGLLAPQPYYADNLWLCGLLACTFILSVVLSERKGYLVGLLREFFLPREGAIKSVRTTSVVYLRAGMYVVSLASVAMLLAMYVSAESLVSMGGGMLWLLSAVVVVLFYFLRILLFFATNRIFFDSSTTIAWEQSYACWTILSGVPFYLLTLLVVFFDLSSSAILVFSITTLILLEICLLYKAFHIFSAKKYGILQIFVYLCTLELMPLLVAGRALVLFV